MNYINQDITTIAEGVLLNGVNCQKAMGSGVALAYLKKWPQVKEVYMATEPVLGNASIICIEHKNLYVANCYTLLGCTARQPFRWKYISGVQ